MASTGETQAALTCRFALAHSKAPAPEVVRTLGNELGVSSLDASFTVQRGWTVASWLVGHAHQLRVTTVSFHGQEWRASTGRWRSTTPDDDRVRFVQAAATT